MNLREKIYNLPVDNDKSKQLQFLDRFSLLRDEFCQKDIVILACGPSLSEYTREEIKDFCKGKIVFCIKQAIHEFKEICDVHFYNDNNITQYSYEDNTVAVSCSSSDYRTSQRNFWPLIRKSDFHFVTRHTRNLKDSLAFTNKFELWEIEKTGPSRPWGPGIMLECVIPVAVFVNPKRVYTLGWDYADPKKYDDTGDTPLEHYYSEQDQKRHFRIPDPPVAKENALLCKNSYYLSEYLKRKKIELLILSKNSYLDASIPRITNLKSCV